MALFIHSFFLFTFTVFLLAFYSQLALVGVVAMAAAREDAFLVIDDQMNENDIDPNSMEEMEKNGTVSNLLKDLLSQNR